MLPGHRSPPLTRPTPPPKGAAPSAGTSSACRAFREEQAAFDAIRAAGVQLWSGSRYEIGTDFLTTLGFTAGAETTQIVKAIEEAGTPPSPPRA